MKKLYTTTEFKKRNTRKSDNSLKISIRRKNKVWREKTVSEINTDTLVPKPRVKPIVPIIAPTNFSLIDNTEATINYFYQAHKALKNKRRILFDISGVTTLTTDAIAVQIAKIKDQKFHFNSGIVGNAPTDKSLEKLFSQSGFYEYVVTNGEKPVNKNKLLIHEITNNKVEPDRAKEAYLLGIKHTFQNEEIFEPLYDILIEIMQNTNNHAGSKRGMYDWWLHVYNHPNSFKTSYTFLDLGVGIFESLPVQSFRRDFLKLFNLKSNIDLVPKLFAGEIKSRTARPERGKGIPQVYECSKHKAFEKFILISNDVYADLKTDENKQIKYKFDGTLFYWEINNN